MQETMDDWAVAIKDLDVHAGGRSILRVQDWKLPRGRHALVLGPSGSGKTTLFHALTGLVRLDQGSVRVNGIDPHALTGTARDRWRGRAVGLVFQQFHLVDALSLLDNLLLAPYLAGVAGSRDRAETLLERLGLAGRGGALPGQLSQGEAQRVAIARALMNEPALILADEPTASLDDRNAATVADLLLEEAERAGATLVVATHDHRLKDRFEETLEVPS